MTGHSLNLATSPVRRNILIADADQRIAAPLANRLGDPDRFVITACASGHQARAQMQQKAFDLLIADLHLPEIDGLTLVKDIRERSPQAVAILIAPTGSSLPQQGLPAQYAIVEPVDVQELVARIHSIFPPQMQPSCERKASVHKVILGGDANVGKTSLIQRYCTGAFDPTREMTLGIDFHVYDVRVDHAPVRLVVWDLGGQARFAYTRYGFYRGSQAVGLVFDVGNRMSFYNLMRWWREVRRYVNDAPILLLGNKIELPRQVSHAEALALAKAWGTPLFECSCATGEGVAEFFTALAQYASRKIADK